LKPRILVTGGTGYIGSHTIVELLQNGFEVIIADNLSNSYIEVVDAIKKITGIKPCFEEIDLCNEELIHELFNKYKGITGVIHFAAYKAVGESVADPLKYYKNNLFSLIYLLMCMKKNKIPNLVFSSSCTIYGEPDELPVKESSTIKKASSPYGNTKQICEEIISDTLQTQDDLNCISLRYFNPIGAHPSALIGEFPIGIPSNLVPYITQTAIGKREYLRVWGDDYPTPDGSCIRDYIHVVDLAKAHVVSMKRLLHKKNKTHYEVFNIGTGKGNSVFEVIATFEEITGVKLNYKVMGRREGDISTIYSDTTLANSELNWKAALTLSDMLYSAWQWEQNLQKMNIF
jgi:UDP-glucose 4-epimerase